MPDVCVSPGRWVLMVAAKTIAVEDRVVRIVANDFLTTLILSLERQHCLGLCGGEVVSGVADDKLRIDG